MGVLVASVLGCCFGPRAEECLSEDQCADEIENRCLAGKTLIKLPQIRQAIEPADFEYLSERSTQDGAKDSQRTGGALP